LSKDTQCEASAVTQQASSYTIKLKEIVYAIEYVLSGLIQSRITYDASKGHKQR